MTKKCGRDGCYHFVTQVVRVIDEDGEQYTVTTCDECAAALQDFLRDGGAMCRVEPLPSEWLS